MGPDAVLLAKPVLVLFADKTTTRERAVDLREVTGNFNTTELCNIWAENLDYQCAFRKYIFEIWKNGELSGVIRVHNVFPFASRNATTFFLPGNTTVCKRSYDLSCNLPGTESVSLYEAIVDVDLLTAHLSGLIPTRVVEVLQRIYPQSTQHTSNTRWRISQLDHTKRSPRQASAKQEHKVSKQPNTRTKGPQNKRKAAAELPKNTHKRMKKDEEEREEDGEEGEEDGKEEGEGEEDGEEREEREDKGEEEEERQERYEQRESRH